MDWSDFAPRPPLFLHTMSRFSAVMDACLIGNAAPTPASTTWTANLAVYVPMTLPFRYPVRRVFWVNGSTASSNVDVGIYTPDGVRLYSTGPTAQSGASAPQYVTPAIPFILEPGRYYFTLLCDGTTNRVWASGSTITATMQRPAGFYEQAVGANTLPATATLSARAANPVPVCGVTLTASGF